MIEPEEIMNLYKKLVSSTSIQIPSSGKIDVSNEHGVYIIYNAKKEVLHVGKTDRGVEGLNQRLNNHLKNQSSFSKKYLRPNKIELRNGHQFKYLEVSKPRTRTLLENLATGLLCPAHIGTREKKETE